MISMLDRLRRFTANSLRPAANLLLATTIGGAVCAQGPTPPPVPEPGCGLGNAFFAVAEALEYPQTRRPTTASFLAGYATKFRAASDIVLTVKGQVTSLVAVAPGNAHEAQQVAAALGSIELGFAGIAADFDNLQIGSHLSYWMAADGFMQLAGLLAFMHPDLADAGFAAAALSHSFGNMSLAISSPAPGSAETYFSSLLGLSPSVLDLAERLMPEPAPALIGSGGGGSAGSTSITCPLGTYPDCETRTWETATAWSCGTWTRFTDGISIGVTTFCPEGGFWVRPCTRTVTRWAQMHCCCYESRWDRFWGIDPFHCTSGTATATGTSTENEKEVRWSCSGSPAP